MTEIILNKKYQINNPNNSWNTNDSSPDYRR